MISHGVKQWPSSNDPYWNNVVLFMNMEGADAGTTFYDLSNTPHTFAISGSGVTTKTNNKKWGTSSSYTNHSGQLQATALAGDVLDGDFTIECWIYPIDKTLGGTNGPGWIGWGIFSAGITLGMDHTTGKFEGYINNVAYTYSDAAIPLNTWSHIALVRVGTSIRGFLNGVRKDVLTLSAVFIPSSSNIRVMGWIGTTNAGVPNSYLDAVRVTKGVARYTESFDPTALTEFPGP